MAGRLDGRLIRRENIIRANDIVDGDIDTADKVGALQAAINSAIGKTFVWNVPYGESTRNYNITDRGLIDTTANSSAFFSVPAGVTMEGSYNAPVDMSPLATSGDVRYAFRSDGTSSSPVPLLVDLDLGQTSANIGTAGINSLALVKGDRVSIGSDRVFIAGGSPTTEKAGEIVTVTSVGSATFEFQPPINDNYPVVDVTRVNKLTMNTRNSFNGIHIIGPGQFNTDTIGDRGFHLVYMDRLSVEGCDVSYCDNAGIYAYSCPDSAIKEMRVLFDETGTNTVNQYGIAMVNACQDFEVVDCATILGKHGVIQTESSLAPGVSRRLTIRDCKVEGTWNVGIGTHTNAEFIEVIRNQMQGCNAGIEAGSRVFRSEGNTVQFLPDNDIGAGIFISDIADNVRSRNDSVFGGRFAFRYGDPSLFAGSSGPRRFQVDDLYATDFSQAGISINSTHVGTTENIHISNVETRRAGNAPSGVTAAPSIDIDGDFSKVTIDNCDLQAETGNTSACIVTTGISNGRVNVVNYSGHTAPILGGTDVTSNNVAVY